MFRTPQDLLCNFYDYDFVPPLHRLAILKYLISDQLKPQRLLVIVVCHLHLTYQRFSVVVSQALALSFCFLFAYFRDVLLSQVYAKYYMLYDYCGLFLYPYEAVKHLH